MVRIAVAGGSGDVGQEIIDVLVDAKKHDIVILSRKGISEEKSESGVKWVKANYEDPKQLRDDLRGIHTVLSFITPQSDPGDMAQKNLINAAVQAGVKRFAPSEWASSGLDYMWWCPGKGVIREYLKELNKDRKILEYTLFQPGMLTNYFASPYISSKHVHPLQSHIDFNNRRAITVNGGNNARLSLTTVQELANVVAKAIEYEGEWPVVGGIRGDELTVGQLLEIGEKVRKGPFRIDEVQVEDLKIGVVKSSWLPRADHPAIPPEEVDAVSARFVSGLMLNISVESMHTSDEWNRLLPDYKFTGAEEFLTAFWDDKP